MALNRKSKADRKTYARAIVREGKTPTQVLSEHKSLTKQSLEVVRSRWQRDIRVCKAIADEVRELGMTQDDILHLIQGRMYRIVSSLAAKDSDAVSASMALAKVSKILDEDTKIAVINTLPGLAEYMDSKRKLLSDKELAPTTSDNEGGHAKAEA